MPFAVTFSPEASFYHCGTPPFRSAIRFFDKEVYQHNERHHGGGHGIHGRAGRGGNARVQLLLPRPGERTDGWQVLP